MSKNAKAENLETQKSDLKAYHLNNILSVISDKPVPHTTNGTTHDYYMADIMQSSDYSAFGVTLSGRNFVKASAKENRRGFNGMEEDDEIKGDGNSYDFGARMFDARLGRFFSVDPKAASYPFMSTYCYASNNPILLIDFEGEGPKVAIIIGIEGNNDFEQHVAYLKSEGYDIIYAQTGKEVLDKLKLRNVNGDDPITNLNILSHGYEGYGVLGDQANSGIYTEGGYENAIIDQAEYLAYSNKREDSEGNPLPNEEDYENARIYVEQNAITASILSLSIENNEIVFAENATITLLGCNLGMQSEVVDFRESQGMTPPMSLAEEIANFAQIAVIASSREIRERKNGVKYESDGLTSPADNYTSQKERTVGGDWVKFNPDGSQVKIGENKINVANNEGN